MRRPKDMELKPTGSREEVQGNHSESARLAARSSCAASKAGPKSFQEGSGGADRQMGKTEGQQEGVDNNMPPKKHGTAAKAARTSVAPEGAQWAVCK